MGKYDLHTDRKMSQMPYWPDARGWIGIGVFGLAIMLLWMMTKQELREDEFFQTIATVIISNGLMAVIAWAYAATKGGGELADKNAELIKDNMNGKTKTVKVVNTEEEAIPVEPSTEGELPEEMKL